MNKGNNTPSNVVSLAVARKKNAGDESPLEACAPQALKFDGDDAWYIIGCDGEQTYMFLAYKKTKRNKRYHLLELYPGTLKKKTEMRQISTEEDLKFKEEEGDKPATFESIGEILEEIEDLLFEGLEFDEDDGGDDDDGTRVAVN
jgi:hypothetical protein